MSRFLIEKSFSKAAQTYNAHASLQKSTATWLSEDIQFQDIRSQDIQNDSVHVLDLGCGTGLLSSSLNLCPKAELYGLDISGILLEEAAKQSRYNYLIMGDMHDMPFKTGKFDLVVSNLAMQWAASPARVIESIKQVLKQDASFHFTVPLPGSLIEIEEAWQNPDNPSIHTKLHINKFVDTQQWQDLGENAGFVVTTQEREFVRWFHTPLDAVKSLKKVGANKVLGSEPNNGPSNQQGNEQSSRQKGLTGKTAYQRMLKNYETKRQKQGVPLTYRILKIKMQSQKVQNTIK